jgi:NitT/TauT family transport system substrate-binding protein
MPSRFPLLALWLPVVVALTACTPGTDASPTPDPSPTSVRLLLGYRPDVQFAPFYYAQQEGLYAAAGLDVTIEHANGPDLLRLVADGEAQFGVADATDVMIARTSDIPVRYVETLYDRFPVAIIGEAGTVPTDGAGLAGKTIGTPGRYGSSWHALLALLASAGLTEADVTIREYPQYNQVAGLLAGDVELITGFRNNEPQQLEAAGMEVDLLTIDEVAPLPGPGVIVGDVVGADADLVARFVTATATAQDAVITDPAAGVAAAAAVVPTVAEDPDAARVVLDATVILWQGEGGFGWGAIDLDLWSAAWETMRSLAFIDGSVPVDEMVDDNAVPAGPPAD